MLFGRRTKRLREGERKDLSLDEILLDASNLPSFDVTRMEGRIELPLARKNVYAVAFIFLIVLLLYSYQLIKLQVIQGAEHAQTSENNRLAESLIIAERGVVTDRNDELVAWNEVDQTGQYDFPVRAYTDRKGLGQLIGYVSYPQKDDHGFYYRTEYLGRSGIEEAFHDYLEGQNGERLVEVSAVGDVISENTMRPPTAGNELQISLDTELSEAMYNIIASTTPDLGFRSGGAAIINIHTGEIVAMTSFPSYDPEILSDGDDVEAIQALNEDERFPFLNKITGGVYTPGSIVKPFVAYAALAENIISPNTTIVSNGSIVIPNPYNPSKPSIFNDWRAHGVMTMRDAIAYSSNVYFYIIGGGFQDQAGLGITKLSRYFRMFGMGEKTDIHLLGEVSGTVPDPAWKTDVFDDDWRLGDTYFTSIGQYGFLATPIQMLRAYAVLANGGTLVTPHVVLGEQGEQIDLGLDAGKLRVVQEGMRATVVQAGGTARALERKDLEIAAKSGTAELGTTNARVNSWIAGYFPYEEPEYAFILFMESGPRANTLGAGRVMSWVFDWMAENRQEFFERVEIDME